MLEPFETWLQSAVAASRNELGAAWQELYLVSPIWRFWIGGDIFGVACAGALMPSVDKVGRFFPLAILYCAETERAIVAPPFDPLDAWYAAIEERLLTRARTTMRRSRSTVSPRACAARKRCRAAGAAARKGSSAASSGSRRGGSGQRPAVGADGADYWATAPARSFWWTNGGGGEDRSSMSATRCPIHFSMQT